MSIIDDNNIINYNLKQYSFNEKKLILHRINELNNKKCNMKIFDIIHKNDIKYSQNNNGVFFNLNQLNDECLINIDNLLTIYEQKKQCLYSKINYTYSESSEKSDSMVIINRIKN